MTIRVDDRRDYGETRYVALGCLANMIVFLAYTLRGDAVRMISMRRASKMERRIYESEAQV